MVRLAALAALLPTVLAQIYDHGCWTETQGATSVRTLGGSSYTNYTTMTLADCQTFCFTTHAAAGYTLFGVEYGGECYCGSSVYTGAFPVLATDCNVNCPGDLTATTKCGGGNRLSVYGTSATPPAFTPNSVPGGPYDTLEYVGCHTEGTGVRALPSASTSSNSLMTIEACGNFCLFGGYKYAGLEYFHECWCANAIDPTSTLASSDSECNAACTGNSAQVCGGGNRLSIYEWTLAATEPEPSSTSSSEPSSTPSSEPERRMRGRRY